MKKLLYIIIIGIIGTLIITCTKRPLPEVFQKSDSPVNPSSGVTMAVVSTGEVTNITMNSAMVAGNVTDDGGDTLTERGVCWSLSQNPNINGNHASNGTGVGSYTVNITELSSDTTYYVRAYAINTAGTSYGDEVSFRTSSEPTKPTVVIVDITNVTTTSGNVTCMVLNDGGASVIERGACWSLGHNPSIYGNHGINGAGVGSYAVNITGLTSEKTYYVRAYARNSVGVAYSDEVILNTESSTTTPTVSTNSVSSISSTSAVCGGNVTSDGGLDVTERGLCWSTSPLPTVNNSHISSGTGVGSFSTTIVGLTPNTTYFVKAYAKNSKGTAYGEQREFVTQTQTINTPTVITSSITNITETSASSGGNVTDNGGATVTDRGVCWSTSQNPTIDDSHTSNGSGLGTFSSDITGLSPNTTYYVRAYATNSAGTGYGTQKSLTTQGNTPPPQTWENGILPGLFSISETQQVHFSQGNLQYQASTNTWKFADNQYDYIGATNSNLSSTYSGWIDLFAWGTSGYNHGANCYQPWSTSTYHGDYFAYGDWSYNLYDQTGKADWGYNRIINGSNTENMWRTLTDSEWTYVINNRYTSSGIRYAKARVDGVGGIILLPDNWNSSIYNLNNTNNENADFDTNVITASVWVNTLEYNGAVFLPSAGYRSYGTIVEFIGVVGKYWSGTRNTADNVANDIYFNADEINTNGNEHRCNGCSVRLVQDY